MLDTGFGLVAVILLGTLLVAASHQAWSAWPLGGEALQVHNMTAASSTGGDSQSAKANASATASATATSSSSATGQGTCSAESSSEAEVRIGNKVVRKSAHKRAAQSGNGCTASSESSAEANTNPSGSGDSGANPQQ